MLKVLNVSYHKQFVNELSKMFQSDKTFTNWEENTWKKIIYRSPVRPIGSSSWFGSSGSVTKKRSFNKQRESSINIIKIYNILNLLLIYFAFINFKIRGD